jgi:hypothetical protein
MQITLRLEGAFHRLRSRVWPKSGWPRAGASFGLAPAVARLALNWKSYGSQTDDAVQGSVR